MAIPLKHGDYCREEIQRIKANNPDISHREAFSTAAKNVSACASYSSFLHTTVLYFPFLYLVACTLSSTFVFCMHVNNIY